MRTLMWFRSDLRTADNLALHHACADARSAVASSAPPDSSSPCVVAVFLLAHEQWREHDWAAAKVDLLLRTLKVLASDLARLDIPLLVRLAPRFVDAPAALLQIACEQRCTALYFNREYEVNERRRDNEVARILAGAGVRVESFDDQVILPPGSVRTQEGRAFTVFTPFKRACYRLLATDASLRDRLLLHPEPKPLPKLMPKTTPKRAPIAASSATPSSQIPDALPGFASSVDPSLWPAGQAHARDRLKRFIANHLTAYKQHRDFPALDATSALSPYLTLGVLSPRQCLAAALNANDGLLDHPDQAHAGPTTWIAELFWREFYKHILVAFPRVSMGRDFKPATERIQWSNDRKLFDHWAAGTTGVPIVDAGMRQLLATGWMHNRVRMIAAMFLAKDLFIDYRWGEQHFMRHLVDGDLAQNNGSWQWSASTGTDAAPYFRIFNPVAQSLRFDPAGDYIRRFVPELSSLPAGHDSPIHDPSKLPPIARTRLDYPHPIVDHSKARQRVLQAFKAL